MLISFTPCATGGTIMLWSSVTVGFCRVPIINGMLGP